MLLLPTGDVVHLLQDETDYYAYTGYGSPQDEWRPAIQTCPTSIVPGSTIQISGTQFNGRSQAVGYGDDSSAATNYPLVRIKNRTSGHVRYCRTFNHTTTDERRRGYFDGHRHRNEGDHHQRGGAGRHRARRERRVRGRQRHRVAAVRRGRVGAVDAGGHLARHDARSNAALSATKKRAASPPVTTRWSKVSDKGSTRRAAG